MKLFVPIPNERLIRFKLIKEKDEIAKTEVISDDRNGKIVAHPADSSEVRCFFQI